MFRNYLKIAWRNLLKNRQFTLLNMAGLTVGLTCALLICLWVQDELGIDRFHEQKLYQVMEHRAHAGGIKTTGETAALLGDALKTMPGVALAATCTPADWFPEMPVSADGHAVRAAVHFAGKDFFRIFSYPLLQGNAQQVLAATNGVVISETLANKLFHSSEDAVGKTLDWQVDSTQRHAMVTGVFKTLPVRSSAQFDAVFSFDVFKSMMGITGVMNNQNSFGPFQTYVVLQKDADTARFRQQMREMMGQRQMFLQLYADNYLYGNYENGVQSGGRIVYVRLFALIAIIIIAIACINFMNLSTAKAAGRVKEMGIRKTAGAGRASLILQYLAESTLLALAALCAAVWATYILLPSFNYITGKQLVLHADVKLIASFVGIALFTGLLAGSYPSFYLSRFNPVAALSGSVAKMGNARARKSLVIFQFTMSVIFIAAVLVVYRQVHYLQSRHPGYAREHVIYFEADGKLQEHADAFLAEARRIPGVQSASGMVGNMIQSGPPSVGVRWEDELIMFQPFLVNDDLIETLDIKMRMGHGFSGHFSADTSKIIFNEAAIRAMGIKDPLGKVIRFGNRTREIAGIVQDFHFQSMHETVKPAFFQVEPRAGTILLRLTANGENAIINKVKQLYETWNPGYAFHCTFLEDAYQAQYRAEQRVAALSEYFAGLAVFISCLGLFGLAAYTGEKRRKEIGIRKVLGATAGNVFLLLSKDFLHSMTVAILLAVPLAWWLLQRWLSGFAFHVQLGADVFLLAAGCMLLLTMLTISIQIVRVAVVNPAGTLKND